MGYEQQLQRELREQLERELQATSTSNTSKPKPHRTEKPWTTREKRQERDASVPSAGLVEARRYRRASAGRRLHAAAAAGKSGGSAEWRRLGRRGPAGSEPSEQRPVGAPGGRAQQGLNAAIPGSRLCVQSLSRRRPIFERLGVGGKLKPKLHLHRRRRIQFSLARKTSLNRDPKELA
ncbi:unnamed protein product [Effrenium voratum]|nr:unnamed protein product [Effrenium voratum]